MLDIKRYEVTNVGKDACCKNCCHRIDIKTHCSSYSYCSLDDAYLNYCSCFEMCCNYWCDEELNYYKEKQND